MSWWKMYSRAALPGSWMTNVTRSQRALVNAEILGQSREEEGPTSADFTCAKQITVQTEGTQTPAMSTRSS